LDEGIANNPDIRILSSRRAGKTTIRSRTLPKPKTPLKKAIAGKDGHEKGLKGSDDYPYAAPLKLFTCWPTPTRNRAGYPRLWRSGRRPALEVEHDMDADKAAGKQPNYGNEADVVRGGA